MELITIYKESRAGNASNEECLDIYTPNAKCIQSSTPAQPPRIDVGKVGSPGFVASLLKKLRSTRSRCGAGTSKDWNSFLFIYL